MRTAVPAIVFLIVNCLLTTGGCSQSKPAGEHLSPGIFIGSTPCDTFIRTILKIPLNINCDFIKWNLTLQPGKIDSFRLNISYGESQPNTNGFIGGGKIMQVTGSYQISTGDMRSSNSVIFSLQSNEFSSPVLLTKMGKNILHLADTNNNLLIGNGGWSYILNRRQ